MRPYLKEKKIHLESYLDNVNPLLIAFSGGVDSSLLLKIAHARLGRNVLAIIATSPIHPGRETRRAIKFVEESGIRHLVVASEEMHQPEFFTNSKDRCYHCKNHLISLLKKTASQHGINYIAHGANMDDLNDFRPGQRAAKEQAILAPLIEAKLTKADIRTWSKDLALSTWNLPSMACLASRIPYGMTITEEILARIEKCENFLIDIGFQACRVRYHDTIARIEVCPDELKNIVQAPIKDRIIKAFKTAGFSYIAIDLAGYTQGSMNIPVL
jgi:pyridinium-3,5-biscarboxylic acid mononucleotide sulfurtransferase